MLPHVIPVGTELVAIGILRPAMNERQHLQMFRAELSGRINEHAFGGDAVVGGPSMRFALGKGTLGEVVIEGSDGTGVGEIFRIVGEPHFGRFLERGMDKRQTRGMGRAAELGVRSR